MTTKTAITMLLGACLLLIGCDDTTKKTEGCGNGLLDLGEECDGDAGDAITCAALGYYEQFDPVRCGADCRWDLSVCAGRCGDGVIQAQHGEDCEGDNLGGNSCITLGYAGGTLACGASCQYDLTACEAGGNCGDGTVEAPEQCEETDLQGETCETLGFYGGQLACDIDCTLDLSACESYGRCGDGVVQAAFGEACDGTEFAGETCVTLGFGSGSLACDGFCGMDTSGCSLDYESPHIGTLIHVPAGTFQRDNQPENLSSVSAFHLSQHEITRAQWVTVTGWADPSDVDHSGGAGDPVQMVNWYDAIAFCNKLSLLEGLTPVYHVSGVDFATLTYLQIPEYDNATWNAATVNWAADGYRLPTESEWMWAAMGADVANPGAVNTTGRLTAFAGSTGTNAIGDYAVFGYFTSDAGRTLTQRTNPVGSKLENELSLFDLSGNLWEWTWDLGGPYPSGTLTDYHGFSTGTSRIRRGGSWGADAISCSAGNRAIYYPQDRNEQMGFRVVRN
jgi:formylglycine-generating enzyme required for sulfatase activity